MPRKRHKPEEIVTKLPEAGFGVRLKAPKA